MKIINFVFCLCLIPVVSGCNKEKVTTTGSDYSTTTHPRHAVYAAALSAYKSATAAPGALLLVDRAGEELWIGASGASELEQFRAMDIHTPVRIGSLTKMYIAVLILKLEQKGLLSLETTLPEVLPALASKIDNSGSIKIRHLLGHLSGLYDPSNESNHYKTDLLNDPDRFGRYDVAQLMDKYVSGASLHFQPGSAFSYSNSGYWVLGLIAESVTGKALPSLLRDELFVPYGLEHTRLEVSGIPAAHGHAITSGNRIKEVTALDKADGDGKAHGGIVSTVADVGMFMRKLFSGRILPSATVDQMKQLQLADCNTDACRYGLGVEIWQKDAITAFGHNGSSVGYEANALFFERSNTVVVLFKNIGGGSDKSFLYELGAH